MVPCCRANGSRRVHFDWLQFRRWLHDNEVQPARHCLAVVATVAAAVAIATGVAATVAAAGA